MFVFLDDFVYVSTKYYISGFFRDGLSGFFRDGLSGFTICLFFSLHIQNTIYYKNTITNTFKHTTTIIMPDPVHKYEQLLSELDIIKSKIHVFNHCVSSNCLFKKVDPKQGLDQLYIELYRSRFGKSQVLRSRYGVRQIC